MAFFRTVSLSDAAPAIVGEGVVLRAPQMSDDAEWGRSAQARASFSFRGSRRGRRMTSPARHFAAASSVIARINAPIWPMPCLFSARRTTCSPAAGRSQISPWLRAGRQPRLLDGRALCPPGLYDRRGRTLMPFAFGTLKLHRVEAACIPANVASVRLLEKTGFQREGLARNIFASMATGRIIFFTRAWRRPGRCIVARMSVSVVLTKARRGKSRKPRRALRANPPDMVATRLPIECRQTVTGLPRGLVDMSYENIETFTWERTSNSHVGG